MRRLAPTLVVLSLLLAGCQSSAEEPAPTVTRSAQPSGSPTSSVPTARTPAPSASVAGPATQVIQINAFTPDGAIASGFTTGPANGSAVVCIDDKGSPNGSSEGTHACGPASLRAQACWRSPLPADAGAALYCLTNPWTPELVRRPATQIPATTPKPEHPVPVGVELADGSRWAYYGGGGWSGYPQGYEPVYECVSGCRKSEALGHLKGEAVVNQVDPTWSMVRMNAGSKEPTPVALTKAWFIESTIRPSAYPSASPTTIPTPGATPTASALPADPKITQVGATITTAADVDKVTTIGAGFKKYLRAQITTLAASRACRKDQIVVDRYHSDGFAAGTITSSCGSKKTYWSKASGTWVEVSSTTALPHCAALSKAKLPAGVVAGKCSKNGKPQEYRG